MKAFYTILALFAIMLGGACYNHVYINHLVQDYITALEPLNLNDRNVEVCETINDLSHHWEKNKKYVQITVTHNEIEAITNALDEVFAYATLRDVPEFEKAKGLLVNALEELWLSEELSLTNIL